MNMYVAISYPSSSFKEYLDFRRQSDPLLENRIFGARTQFKNPNPSGGVLEILDWETKEPVWRHNAPTPAGFVFHKNRLYVCDELGDRIIGLDRNGKIVESVKNNFINYPHDLVHCSHGFLVTSTGLDIIMEVTIEGAINFAWWAMENGYDTTPEGEKRVIDKLKNHRGIRYATLQRTVHINSANYLRGDRTKVVASLFHPGQIVLIDPSRKETHVVVDELDHPHGVHNTPYGGLIFSETGRNRIHVLDRDLQPEQVKELDCEWIQDAAFTGKGTILVGDANQHKVHEFTYPRFEKVDSYSYDENLKLFKVEYVTTETLRRFLGKRSKNMVNV
jgi:hypothetical protein